MLKTLGIAIKNLSPRGFISLVILGAALGIAGALWLSNGPIVVAGQCPLNEVARTGLGQVATGELAALRPTADGRNYSDLSFVDQKGNRMTLADFSGKPLLVNFWATWCGSCRAEMPELDTISAQYGGKDFAVISIGLDMGDDGIQKEQAFMADNNLANLPLFSDPSFAAFNRLKNSGVSLGLPTTLLLDAKGCELAVLQGPAPWAGKQGNAVVEKLIQLHRETT